MSGMSSIVGAAGKRSLSWSFSSISLSRSNIPKNRLVRLLGPKSLAGHCHYNHHHDEVVPAKAWQHRSLSSHSSYEYPLRNEAPVITRTLASTCATDDKNNNNKEESPAFSFNATFRDKSRLSPNEVDHFDDSQSLSPSERKSLLSQQQHTLNTTLDRKHRILPHPPPYIPPNVSQEQLAVPETFITTLTNGIRVASQETYGQVCTVGLLSECGSRHETFTNRGVNHLMELLAFQSTQLYPHTSDLIALMDKLGGATFASSSREQFMYCIDVLRPSVKEAMKVLAQTTLFPLLTEEEIGEMKRVVEFQWLDILPEIRLGEGLQIAAYGIPSSKTGSDGLEQEGELQQLGKPHFCPLEALPNLTAQTVRDFRNANLLNPRGMVIAGAGIEHEELVAMAEEHFGSIALDNPNEAPTTATTTTTTKAKFVPSTYTGGEYRLQIPTVDGFTRVALAFELGGWHSDDLVPTCVLQTLLGGGNSFSAGGPGKGMYSRLYREVLNRYYWAESAEAFTSFHTESGLLGISGSSVPAKSRDMTRVIAEHFARLAIDLVSDEELDRARNMLKCNVLTQLESRLVLFEDIGRQILTYGKREGTKSMCEKIDAVSKDDIREVARRAISKPPTIATVGDDVGAVPSHDEIAGWFKH